MHARVSSSTKGTRNAINRHIGTSAVQAAAPTSGAPQQGPGQGPPQGITAALAALRWLLSNTGSGPERPRLVKASSALAAAQRPPLRPRCFCRVCSRAVEPWASRTGITQILNLSKSLTLRPASSSHCFWLEVFGCWLNLNVFLFSFSFKL